MRIRHCLSPEKKKKISERMGVGGVTEAQILVEEEAHKQNRKTKKQIT